MSKPRRHPPGVARDTFAVQIRNSSGAILKTLATYSNLNAATGYKVYSFDLAEYKGQTIQLYFLGAEDAALSTGFILDKVNLMVTAGVAVAVTRKRLLSVPARAAAAASLPSLPWPRTTWA